MGRQSVRSYKACPSDKPLDLQTKLGTDVGRDWEMSHVDIEVNGLMIYNKGAYLTLKSIFHKAPNSV